jgi:competence protein ComEC
MKIKNYPILRMLLPYLAGVLFSYFFISTHLNILIFTLVPVLLLATAVLFRLLLPLRGQPLAIVALCVAFFLLGALLTNARYCPTNFSNIRKMVENSEFFTLQILEKPVEKEKSVRLHVHLESDKQGQRLRTNAILYLKKNPQSMQLRTGDFLVVHTRFSEISPPKNPYAFDNQKYMRRKSIFFTAYASENQWHYLSHRPIHPLRTAAAQVQQHFSALFAQNGLQGEEYSIITAVLLGNDDSMEPELKAHFASAGVSHILCVSGMHVGIIFMIINFLLKPLDAFPRLRILKALLLILVIWTYAHITGLAPSVRRAATMFSFVTIGSLLHRPTTIYHSLFASMFILLLFNPLLFFEIGFQMSYLAVFGIVMIQPPLTRLWAPKYKVINYFWELATVSVAAQLATFPLSLFYFGQFPNYFLLSNLSVISLSFVIVMTGIALLALSWLPPLSRLVGLLLTYEIRWLNGIVKGIESLPGSVTDNIAVNLPQMLLIYGIVVIISVQLMRKNFRHKYLILSMVLLLSVSIFAEKVILKNQHKMTFYSMEKMSAVECNWGTQGVLLLDSAAQASPMAYDFNIKNHIRMQHIDNERISLDTSSFFCPTLAKQGDFLKFDTLTVFFLSGCDWLYPLHEPVEVDVLCLRHNPRIPMHKLLQTFRCRTVVIDGTNSPYYEQRWIDSCHAYKIPCHSTRREGYFSL